MRKGERGYTLIELAVALSVIVLISGAASIAIFQIMKGTSVNNTHMTAVRQVQNAGYWLSRDARMAQSVETDNLTPPNFIVFNWREWDEDDEEIFHTSTYFFEDLTDGVGKLKRTHWSSAGLNNQTLIADHIYYDPDDTKATSQFSYQTPVLTMQLTSRVENAVETREYRITHRPNI